jgi:hypothetical protein
MCIQRPSLVEFGRRAPHYDSGVVDVVMEGVTLKDSPFWTFSGRGLKRARITGVSVTTTGCGYSESPNTDGFNVQGEDILIENCAVRNGDDCVPIFPPSRNVTVRNITCECGNGLVPVIWSSMSVPGQAGSIRDVMFDGATFTDTANAAAIKSLPCFEGEATNITFKNFKLHKVQQAIMINMYNQNHDSPGPGPGPGPSPGLGLGGDDVSVGSVSSVTIENITGSATRPGKIMCGPQQGGCQGISMVNVTLQSSSGTYICDNAYGNATGCKPAPCGWGDGHLGGH